MLSSWQARQALCLRASNTNCIIVCTVSANKQATRVVQAYRHGLLRAAWHVDVHVEGLSTGTISPSKPAWCDTGQLGPFL